MTKILKSKYKVSRRLGASIWGNDKDPFHTKNYRPGQHGAKNRGKLSDYGLHLNVKQMIKNHYGPVTEKQFRNTFNIASKMKGNTAENFAGLLEARLDIIVYRMNFAPTIFSARQLVSHCHVLVNGKKVNIPSQRLKVGDKVEVRESSKQVPIVMEAVQKLSRPVPEYLSMDPGKMSGEFLRVPMISDIPYPFEVQFGKVVEYYSH